MNLSFSKTTLANGLDVIVHEDHRAPLVAVSVWYHVGSKNERPGQTGLAHLFEHVMFEGSAHVDGFFEPLQRAGASLNGSTSTDRTNYWEVVPRGALERALWMEADRMGWLLPALSEARFSTQREVVLNERRQNYENRPYGLASFAISKAMYPAGHPYHWPTIGDPDDLRAATVDDARAFFTKFYHPANASLAIAGDVSAEAAVALAVRLFGDIPRGPAVDPVLAPLVTRAHAPRRLVIEDRVELPRLYLNWPAPAFFDEGDAALDFAADLLANGKTSRLYRQLVYDAQIAAELSAGQGSRELCSLFQVVASASPGHTLTELEHAIIGEIARVGQDGPSADEMARGHAQVEASFLHRLQTLGGFGGKADQLNAYNVYRRTPAYFDTDLERYRRLTAGDVGEAVRTWLAPERAVALSVVPHGRADLALADSAPIEVH